MAIKTLRAADATSMERDDFYREAATVYQIDHPNVVALVGVVTQGDPTYLVMQHCANGSLDHFLQKHRSGIAAITTTARLKICFEVACGMQAINDLRLIHRDLAARNVLLTGDNVCKIADFGMTRALTDDKYYTMANSRKALPLRWTDLRALLTGSYNLYSDVWSYGVFVWEVFSHAEMPYGDMPAMEILQRLQEGLRLNCPPACPPAVFSGAVIPCWNSDGNARPRFRDLAAYFEACFTKLQAAEAASAAAARTAGEVMPPASQSSGALTSYLMPTGTSTESFSVSLTSAPLPRSASVNSSMTVNSLYVPATTAPPATLHFGSPGTTSESLPYDTLFHGISKLLPLFLQLA